MKFLWRYIAHDDGLVAAGNLIALVLGYNTPLYPLYLHWVTGFWGMPWVLLTLCSCPLFLAVPAVARRAPRAARLMLVGVGTLNTVFCTWLLGLASGTEMFLVPCILLSALLFRPRERVAMAGAALLPLLAFCLSGYYGVSPVVYSPAQAHAVLRLNAGSVGTLCFFIGFVFARLLADSTRAPPAPRDRETVRSS